MYSECLDGIGEFKKFKYHIELDPQLKPSVQIPHKVALSTESRLKKNIDQIEKTRHNPLIYRPN